MSDLKPPENRDELLVAVLAMVDEVKVLNKRLELYAPRDEVKRTFRSGAWRFFVLALVCILVSQALTMTTISVCFLNANSKAPAACSIMPGYEQALSQNDVRLDRFSRLLDGLENANGTAQQNGKKIDDIDRRLKKLEEGAGK